MNIQEYYNNPVTRKGIKNFMKGCGWFLVSGSQYSRDPSWGSAPPVRVFDIDEFDQQLGQGPDIFRPIINWDGVLGVFDMEFYNWDKMTLFKKGENGSEFGVRDTIFKEQIEPVYRIISEAFGDECIADVTWSGYHFLTDIRRHSNAYNALLDLGSSRRENGTPRCLEESLIEAYKTKISDDPKRRYGTSINDGIVYHQFGRVLEFLSHEIIRGVKNEVDIPVTICDTREESLSLDISQYADPVYMRIIRTIFSSWDKHNMTESIANLVGRPPFLDVIRKYSSFETDDLDKLFAMSRDYEAAIEHNKQFEGHIPVAGEKVVELINNYKHSKLKKFHDDFDSEEHNPDDKMYKLAKFNTSLDIRARQLMEFPNVGLLQPMNIKWITKHLMKKGWHPKHIGGMLAGRYEAKGKGWNDIYWSKYNTRTRGNFWARVYAGLKTCKVKT